MTVDEIKEAVISALNSDEGADAIKRILVGMWFDVQTDVGSLMRLQSALRSAEFVRNNIPLKLAKDHLALRRDAVLAAPEGGLFLEFGVFKGYWINEMARARPHVHFFGFDSFEGLPEGWEFLPAGHFDLGGVLPPVEENVTLVKGWFNETIEPFLEEHSGPVSFVHIDCDLYSSTKTVLDAIWPRIRPGTQIVMDDFMVAPGWENEEHKAFFDFINEHGIGFKYTGWSNQTPSCSAGVVITAVP